MMSECAVVRCWLMAERPALAAVWPRLEFLKICYFWVPPPSHLSAHTGEPSGSGKTAHGNAEKAVIQVNRRCVRVCSR